MSLRPDLPHLGELERNGTMCWRAEDHAWIADPDDVARALTDDGFHEYRREIARRARTPASSSGIESSGGMWQGLDRRTGAIATVIWVTNPTPAHSHVFIEIEGRPVDGSAWDEIDHAVIDCLVAAGGTLTLAQIAHHVGMSEGAVQSVVSMLAEQGRLRIAAVELVGGRRLRPAQVTGLEVRSRDEQ
jgi:Winged helix-turn-helix DNA-binding